MTNVVKTFAGTWKSAQLFLGFHKDPEGRARKTPKVWPPRNASASIHEDPSVQEAFVILRAADPGEERDVQIKLRRNEIILRRDAGAAWAGVLATDHSVTVLVGDLSITINHDGSITRKADADTTWVEADGSVLKQTDLAIARMSADGVELERATEDSVASIREDGVMNKLK